MLLLFAFRWRHHVHSTVVQRPLCKIGKMAGKLWKW